MLFILFVVGEVCLLFVFFFFNDTATTEIYTLSLHDALPISAYATDDVLARMAQILAAGTGASGAHVWLLVGRELRPAASWPEGGAAPSPLPLEGSALPAFPGESAFEVRHRDELLGALTVRMPTSDPINHNKAKLVADLAAQAGLVVRNVRLIEELRASRQRMVAAQDQERRRL